MPQPITVILETPQSSVPINTVEKSVEKIKNTFIEQPLRKKRKNFEPALVTFTRQKNNIRIEQNAKSKKQYSPDEAF